jgi:hypothetical protein
MRSLMILLLIGSSAAAEGSQEVHKIVDLIRAKPEGLHLGIEEWIMLPSFAEEFDDVPQSLKTSVMHVRA